MALKTYFLLSSLLLLILLALIHKTQAVTYTISNTAANTPGGARFSQDIGIQYTQQVVNSGTNFIWNIFQQRDPKSRKNTQRFSVFIDDMTGLAYTSNDEIHFSARYINGYSGDLKREFAGVMYHEMVHIWQWNDNQAPSGLIDGIADFVRLKAGYAPSYWVQPGQGEKWDQGYDVTAHFLNYCDCLKKGFVAKLNKKMRSGYNNQYFVDLLGKTVDQLWNDYKAKYNM